VKKIGSSDAVVASFQMGDGPVSTDLAYPFRVGDLNGDGQTTPADVVAMLECVFSGCAPAPRNSQIDLNRDGQKTPGDVVCELNHVFLGAPLPCR
jgi:hypothetical protein